jgi:RNA polymerase sigma-70 factor (ECF subfamily)
MEALALKLQYRFNLLRRFYPVQDDSALARLVLRGDLQAEEELVTRHYAKVYRVAYGVLCEHHGAMDVAQGVFARLRRVLKSYDGRSALSSYLCRVGVNAAIDELRRQKRRAEVAQPEEMPLASQDTNEADPEVVEIVRIALSELPARQRAAVTLRDIQGMSTEEAAEALGITPSGFRTILAEGRLRLKQVLERLFPEYSDWS